MFLASSGLPGCTCYLSPAVCYLPSATCCLLPVCCELDWTWAWFSSVFSSVDERRWCGLRRCLTEPCSCLGWGGRVFFFCLPCPCRVLSIDALDVGVGQC
jgi:hypothetical protein